MCACVRITMTWGDFDCRCYCCVRYSSPTSSPASSLPVRSDLGWGGGQNTWPSIARSCSIGGFAAAPVTIDKKKKLQINNTSAFCLAYQSTTGHQPGATVFTTVRMTQSRIFNLHNTTDSATAQPKVLNHLNTFSNFTSLCLTLAEKTSHRKRKTTHPHLRIISR